MQCANTHGCLAGRLLRTPTARLLNFVAATCALAPVEWLNFVAGSDALYKPAKLFTFMAGSSALGAATEGLRQPAGPALENILKTLIYN